MITNPGHNYLYFDLTKTASQSIIAVLCEHYAGMAVTEIPEKVDCIFTVVRSPYTRVLSTWWSLCQTGGDYYGMERCGLREASFLSFLQWLVLADMDTFSMFGAGVAKLFFTMTQHLDGLSVDHILRYESLDEQFQSLPFHRGVPERLPVLNKKGTIRKKKALYG